MYTTQLQKAQMMSADYTATPSEAILCGREEDFNPVPDIVDRGALRDHRCKWCGKTIPDGHVTCEGCTGAWVCPTCSRVNGREILECLECKTPTPFFVKENEDVLFLHLGAGTRKLPGYTSVDIRPEVEPDIVADIERLDEFQNASAEVIYAAHVLEHIPRPHTLAVLEEWRRVLKPGGTLRLSVPDLQVLAELYLYEDVSMWRITGPLHGRQDYEANTHYVSFDYEYLAWMLGVAGYHDIRQWYPLSDHPSGYDDISLAKINERYISLNVEATA